MMYTGWKTISLLTMVYISGQDIYLISKESGVMNVPWIIEWNWIYLFIYVRIRGLFLYFFLFPPWHFNSDIKLHAMMVGCCTTPPPHPSPGHTVVQCVIYTFGGNGGHAGSELAIRATALDKLSGWRYQLDPFFTASWASSETSPSKVAGEKPNDTLGWRRGWTRAWSPH